jgi:NAD(P)-dependent dehydrogenase (short-subunit alcohol dehydrogenase family)
MPAPVASGWSESPGGACTHWKSAALSRRTWIPDLPEKSLYAASTMAMPKRTACVASKHGVVGLTKQMALEFGEFDIRVNAVAPGLVRTPMTERYFQDPAMAQTIRDIHAVGRWAEPHEIANAILFLAAEENAFITGTILTVDGGLPLAKRCRLRNVTMEVQYYPTPITKSPVAAVT